MLICSCSFCCSCSLRPGSGTLCMRVCATVFFTVICSSAVVRSCGAVLPCIRSTHSAGAFHTYLAQTCRNHSNGIVVHRLSGQCAMCWENIFVNLLCGSCTWGVCVCVCSMCLRRIVVARCLHGRSVWTKSTFVSICIAMAVDVQFTDPSQLAASIYTKPGF